MRGAAAALGCSTTSVQRWSARFRTGSLSGLAARHKGRTAGRAAARLEAHILEWTRRRQHALEQPPAGSETQYLPHDGVEVWRRHGLQPHRLRHQMASDDPDFESKAADIIGPYLPPPAHAAVFCVDEKTAIQALDWFDPVLPLSPGRAKSHGFEYFRHGTLSLYAALETQSGTVLGKTAARHSSAGFVGFLEQIVASQPAGRRFTSSPTIFPPTKPGSSPRFCRLTPRCGCITHPLTPPG